MDNAINGRPEQAKIIRIRLTPAQIRKLDSGKILDFKAGIHKVEIAKK